MKIEKVYFAILVIFVAADSILPNEFKVEAGYKYSDEHFVIEMFNTGRNARTGSRLEYKSILRYPMFGLNYTISKWTIGAFFSPYSSSYRNGSSDIDFECWNCDRNGPSVDLANFTVHDRMERNAINNSDIFSHSYSNNVAVSHAEGGVYSKYSPSGGEGRGFTMESELIILLAYIKSWMRSTQKMIFPIPRELYRLSPPRRVIWMLAWVTEAKCMA